MASKVASCRLISVARRFREAAEYVGSRPSYWWRPEPAAAVGWKSHRDFRIRFAAFASVPAATLRPIPSPRGSIRPSRKYVRANSRSTCGRFMPRPRFHAPDAGHEVRRPAPPGERVPRRGRLQSRGGGDRPRPGVGEDPRRPEALRAHREVHSQHARPRGPHRGRRETEGVDRGETRDPRGGRILARPELEERPPVPRASGARRETRSPPEGGSG